MAIIFQLIFLYAFRMHNTVLDLKNIFQESMPPDPLTGLRSPRLFWTSGYGPADHNHTSSNIVP